ncbi:MAG: hypothetical protein J5833_08745 [Victivallales bacterium]|nr:hypothetical protein [Victivallales bacterium]
MTDWPILFEEDFDVLQGTLPANWHVERNSNLPITAWVGHEGSFDLLSAGNKYIPVIPDIADFSLEMGFSVNYSVADEFKIILTFHYDMFRREGDSVRISCKGTPAKCKFEFGHVADNIFTPVAEVTHEEVPAEALQGVMSVRLVCIGRKAAVSFAGFEDLFEFEGSRAGKVCLAREHFLDILTVSRFIIAVPELPAATKRRTIRVQLPEESLPNPIYCELELEDFGDCTCGTVTLSGGVRDTPPGEGDYHVMRADILTNPYFKVMDDDRSLKFTLFQGEAIMAQDEMTPAYFYTLLHKRPQWPLKRRILFFKQDGKNFFAVGADTCLNTTTYNTALSPGETMFDEGGKVIYSGKGISEAAGDIVFTSQEDKEIVGRLPKDDPRYDMAVAFARRNHYFLSEEKILFTVNVSARNALPLEYEIALEDVFLTKLRDVPFKATFSTSRVANFDLHTATLRCDDLSGLAEGVYHLRLRSVDATGVPLEDYCAFEVMGRGKDALPPPLLSGLPYLYDSRTETRGLETDSFDPWHVARVDEGHYMACANFLPVPARKYNVAPTVHAYHREWFLWLASRCVNKPMMRDNEDLIAQADYISHKEELEFVQLYARSNYGGGRLPQLVEFLRKHPDSRYDYNNIKELEAAVADGRGVDSVSTSAIINGGFGEGDPDLSHHNFEILAKYHWSEWLEFRNRYMADKVQASLDYMRRLQPHIKFSAYGPANIYYARCKGQEFVKAHQSIYLTDDMVGFYQYEDYPYSCSYPIVRGTYMLAASLMVLPYARIYPEYYTKGIQGCPDGAVYYAHPPFGFSEGNPARRFKLVCFDYVFASGHFLNGAFRYWSKYGFQVCKFNREYYENMLRAWRHVVEHKPVRPIKSAAFVFSEKSRGTVKVSFTKIMYHVRESGFEAVPFAYEMSRCSGQLAGFQINIGELAKLTPDDTDLLVLPPLTGATAEELDAIRKLHASGVNLLLFEDAAGLEDIFGVKPLDAPKPVTNLHSTDLLPFSLGEYCEEPLCAGRYAADGADVLIDAEVPVLLSKRNGAARAVFCNVPPTFVRDCQLHQSDSIGRESISELINKSIAFVMGEMTGSAADTSEGRIIGFKDEHGDTVIVIQNTDESEIHPVVRYRKVAASEHIVECDKPWRVLEDGEDQITCRLSVPPENAAIIVISK